MNSINLKNVIKMNLSTYLIKNKKINYYFPMVKIFNQNSNISNLTFTNSVNLIRLIWKKVKKCFYTFKVFNTIRFQNPSHSNFSFSLINYKLITDSCYFKKSFHTQLIFKKLIKLNVLYSNHLIIQYYYYYYYSFLKPLCLLFLNNSSNHLFKSFKKISKFGNFWIRYL